MDIPSAIATLSSLAQPTRLDAFRLLVRETPQGLPAGEIAKQLDIPANTLSTHIAILERAGLVTSERRGRSIVYCAEIDAIRALAAFLVNDCCGGRPELCTPLIADITPCCNSAEAPHA